MGVRGETRLWRVARQLSDANYVCNREIAGPLKGALEESG